MAVSKRLRFEVFKRDGHTCQYCGATAPDVVLQVDHVLATSLGGTDHPANLVTACVDCNSGKGSSSPSDAPVAAVDRDSIRWAKAVEQVAADRRRHRETEAAALEAFRFNWPFTSIPDDWQRSVSNFVRTGLNTADLLHILEKAHERTYGMDHCWRYFCKVAWSEIRAIQERAAAVLSEAPDGLDEPAVDEMACPLLQAIEDGTLPPFQPVELEQPPWFQQNYQAVPVMCAECDERPILREGLCERCMRIHYDNFDGAL